MTTALLAPGITRRGSFRFSACRCRYVIVPAWPSASQRSSSAAWGLRSSRAIPVAANPNAVARRFISTLFTFSQSHRFPPPAGEVHDVAGGWDGCFVAVGGEHAPAHVVTGRNWKKRGPTIPVAGAKTPREAQQIDGESRTHQRPER